MSNPKNSKLLCKETLEVESSSSDGDPDIFKLTTDCLTHIFSFLSIPERIRIQRVCKLWQKVSTLPWHDMKKLDIGNEHDGFLNGSINKNDFKISILKQLLRLCGPCLTHIELSIVGSLTSKELLVLVRKMCPNLQSIDFGITLSRKGMEFLSNNFSNVRDCTIESCSKNCEDTLSTFLSSNQKLKSFSICNSDCLTGSCLRSLPAEKIECIKIRGCKKFLPENLINVLQKCSEFKILIIEGNKKLVLHLNKIIKSLPVPSNLTTLTITYMHTHILYRNLVHLSDICKLTNLQTLELWGEHTVHNETLTVVGKHCKDLRRATLGWSNRVKDIGLKSITNLPKLEYLQLDRLEKITDQVFTVIPKLKTLICVQCHRLKNKGFCLLLKTSENLEHLQVRECEKVSKEALIDDAKIAVNTKFLKICVDDETLLLL